MPWGDCLAATHGAGTGMKSRVLARRLGPLPLRRWAKLVEQQTDPGPLKGNPKRVLKPFFNQADLRCLSQSGFSTSKRVKLGISTSNNRSRFAFLVFLETPKGRCASKTTARPRGRRSPNPRPRYAASGDLCPSRTPAWCDRVIYRFEPPAAWRQRGLQGAPLPWINLDQLTSHLYQLI